MLQTRDHLNRNFAFCPGADARVREEDQGKYTVMLSWTLSQMLGVCGLGSSSLQLCQSGRVWYSQAKSLSGPAAERALSWEELLAPLCVAGPVTETSPAHGRSPPAMWEMLILAWVEEQLKLWGREGQRLNVTSYTAGEWLVCSPFPQWSVQPALALTWPNSTVSLQVEDPTASIPACSGPSVFISCTAVYYWCYNNYCRITCIN